ncbi:MAG: hypothetical protein IPK98_19740 [Chloracidobacterium sp.]|nr:hypothetical protein [Chloracidobacterium sp.]
MVTRLLAATFAGGITFFVLGFVIYGLILENAVMKPNMNTYAGLMNEVPVWVPLVFANLVSALLLAYIFEQWASIRTFVGGMKGGAIVMFLISLSFQLMFLAFMNLHKNYIPPIADVLGSIVMGAIGGGVIGAVLGMMNKEA